MSAQKWCLPVRALLAIIVSYVLIMAPGCNLDSPLTNDAAAPGQPGESSPGQGVANPMITGDVEIVWKGGKGQDSTQAAEVRRAFLYICAFEPAVNQPGHGTAVYTVTNEIGEIHRQIVIELEGSRIDALNAKAWYRGVVVSDTKGCGGGPDAGHSTECPGDTAGCGEDHDHTEGGCNSGGVDEGHDGGCSSHSAMGGSGGMGGPQVSGRNCRVGQYFVGKAHDGGTPGTNGDGITWKWFDAANPNVPVLEDLSTWSHLCAKTIISGNIVVHTGTERPTRTAGE